MWKMKIGPQWRQHTVIANSISRLSSSSSSSSKVPLHSTALSHPLDRTTSLIPPSLNLLHHARIPGVAALLGALRIFDVQWRGGAKQKQQPEQLPASGQRRLPDPEQRLRRGQHEGDVQGWRVFMLTSRVFEPPPPGRVVVEQQQQCWACLARTRMPFWSVSLAVCCALVHTRSCFLSPQHPKIIWWRVCVRMGLNRSIYRPVIQRSMIE